MLMWEYSKSWASHAARISGWTTKHARRILEEVVWSGSSESQFRSTYFRYACLTESKSRGFWVGKQRKLKQKALKVFLVFLFEKTDGAHISAMLAVQSQRAGVSRWQTALLATKEFWSVCTFCWEKMVIAFHEEMWRLQKLCSTASYCFIICSLSDLTPRWASDICFLLTLLNLPYSALARMIRPSPILVSEPPFWLFDPFCQNQGEAFKN